MQEVLDKGDRKRVPVLKDIAFRDFTHTALVADRKDPEQKKFRRRVVKVGIDPHTSYANMLCDVAWARAYGTGFMLLPPDAATAASVKAEQVAARMPGLPQNVLRMIADIPEGTCGRCDAFAHGMCTLRGLQVGQTDPGCELYVAAPLAKVDA